MKSVSSSTKLFNGRRVNGPTALMCCLLALPGAAQTPLQTLLVGIDHRSTISLNGPWRYLVDPPPAKALYTSEGKVRNDGYALNTHPNISSGPHNDEYDFATAPTLKVPGDWNTQEPSLFRFEGVVWYERDLICVRSPTLAPSFTSALQTTNLTFG